MFNIIVQFDYHGSVRAMRAWLSNHYYDVCL